MCPCPYLRFVIYILALILTTNIVDAPCGPQETFSCHFFLSFRGGDPRPAGHARHSKQLSAQPSGDREERERGTLFPGESMYREVQQVENNLSLTSIHDFENMTTTG